MESAERSPGLSPDSPKKIMVASAVGPHSDDQSERQWLEDMLSEMRASMDAHALEQQNFIRRAVEDHIGLPPLVVRGPLASPSRRMAEPDAKQLWPAAVEPEQIVSESSKNIASQPHGSSRPRLADTAKKIQEAKHSQKKLLKEATFEQLDLAASSNEVDWLHAKIAGLKPQHSQKLKFFDLFMGGIIVVNTCVLFAQLEWEGRRGAARVGFNAGKESFGEETVGSSVFAIMEHIFAWIYLVELGLRIGIFGKHFLHDWTNLLDTCVVVVTCIDVYVVGPDGLASSANGSNSNYLNIVKVMRLARLARALRFVRILKLFPALRVLVRTIAVSVGSLMWSMFILFVFGVVSAMLLCQTVQDVVADSSLPLDTRRWVDDNYGTSTKAAWSVFELTMSGCWPNYSHVLIHDVSPLYAIFFAFYVAMVVFAVIRIITALFLKDTLQVAANDAESIVASKMKQKMDYTKKLAAFFLQCDISGDGKISREEFMKVLSIKDVQLYLSALELDTGDLEGLYGLLASKKGTISFNDFVHGVLRLKGTARSMDVVSLMMDSKLILEKCDLLMDLMHDVIMESITEDGLSTTGHPRGRVLQTV